MSLRHILNEDPDPVHARSLYPPSSLAFHSDQPSFSGDLGHSPHPPSPPGSYMSQPQSRELPAGRQYDPVARHYDPEWESRSGQWSSAAYPSTYTNEDTRYSYDRDHVLSPVDPPSSFPQEEDDVISRKRRKGGDEDPEYMPSKPRRVCTFNACVLLVLNHDPDQPAKDAEGQGIAFEYRISQVQPATCRYSRTSSRYLRSGRVSRTLVR